MYGSYFIVLISGAYQTWARVTAESCSPDGGGDNVAEGPPHAAKSVELAGARRRHIAEGALVLQAQLRTCKKEQCIKHCHTLLCHGAWGATLGLQRKSKIYTFSERMGARPGVTVSGCRSIHWQTKIAYYSAMMLEIHHRDCKVKKSGT